ETLLDLDFLE
nr:Chain E, Amphiphysin [Rattus norvegicus]5M5T_F Chain F, Amphiphysin [Rattus norvegicus]5M5T_G Chain G, Amphiphysin [Rattus norvegicus]5M5T_H Chain H, Amphiphysin [Rattus norvegicus]5M5T_I Chain I, Amphiphysin [Rattus norvegicus]5M5T_J Chain J, Amphiphysin [Rattus norvegicus]